MGKDKEQGRGVDIRRPLAGNGFRAKLGEGQSLLKVTTQTAITAQGKSTCTWWESISYLRLSLQINLTLL